jgi:hypothetical protein
MPVLASCPKCPFEGPLPDDDPGGMIACPKCGTEFVPAAALPSESPAVWVGAGASPTATPPPRRGLNPLPTAATGKPVEVTAANAAKHLDWLRAEVARFDAYVARQLDAVRQQRDDLATAESNLVARTLQVTREKAALEADRETLVGRAAELDRAERALQRRTAEVDELEQLLRGELEEREAELDRQRRAVAESLAELRARAPHVTTTDHLLDAGHCG